MAKPVDFFDDDVDDGFSIEDVRRHRKSSAKKPVITDPKGSLVDDSEKRASERRSEVKVTSNMTKGTDTKKPAPQNQSQKTKEKPLRIQEKTFTKSKIGGSKRGRKAKSDGPVSIRGLSREIYNIASASVAQVDDSVTLTQRDVIIAFILMHSDVPNLNALGVSKDVIKIVEKYKRDDLFTKLMRQLDAMQGKINGISSKVDATSLMTGYLVYERLGFRQGRLPANVEDISFEPDSVAGVVDKAILQSRYLDAVRAKTHNRIFQAARRKNRGSK